MKSVRVFVLGLLIGILISSPFAVFANDVEKKVEAYFSKFNFVINGESKIIEADPLVYQGTTYLPVRVVANMLGYDVTYKANSKTIEFKRNTAINNYQLERTGQMTENIQNTTQAQQEEIIVRDNTIYLLLSMGVEKYNIPKSSPVFDRNNKTINFSGTSYVINYLESYEPNAEAFYESFRLYIKESHLIAVKNLLEASE